MDFVKVNFRCPAETVKAIDADADADHRDRTSMLNKIIAFYYENHPNDKKPNPKKAGK
jgi:hypothetical protein